MHFHLSSYIYICIIFPGTKYRKGAKCINAIFKEEFQKRCKCTRPSVTYILNDDDFEPSSSKRPALSVKSSTETQRRSSVTTDPKIASRILSLEYQMVKVESELFKQQLEFERADVNQEKINLMIQS